MADISYNNISGGVNVSAGEGINIGGDVVGRDKITNYQIPPQPPSLHQLIRPPSRFFGREVELNALKKAVAKEGHTILGIFGMGGVGKTALALTFANYLRPQYPDAQILCRFGGEGDDVDEGRRTKSVNEAMQYVVNSFRPEITLPDNQNALSAAYQDTLAGKRVLLLIDDVTFVKNIEQLVPQDTTCLLLFTSRKHFDLPNYRICPQNLLVLSPQHSRKYLLDWTSKIGNQAGTIAELCGHLPLALRIAGSFLAKGTKPPEVYAQELRDEQNRLKSLDGIEASISVSYQNLSAFAQRVFRSMGVFPAASSFDGEAEESICDDKTSAALHTLVEYSLVDRLSNSGLLRQVNRTDDRFQIHNLVRIFARSRLSVEPAHFLEIQGLHAEYYERAPRIANTLYLERGDTELRGLQLFDQERKNIETGQIWSAEHSSNNDRATTLCSKFAEGGKDCIALRLFPEDQARWRKDALASARRLNSWSDEAVHEGELGNIDAGQGEPVFAINHHEQQLSLARQVGERVVECDALGNLGNAYFDLGQFDRAIELYGQQRALARELNNPHKEHVALANLAGAYILKGDYDQALGILDEELKNARKFEDTESESIILLKLGLIYFRQKDYTEATRLYREGRNRAHKIGDCRHEGDAWWNMSICALEQDDLPKAIKYAERALELLIKSDGPRAAEIQDLLPTWQERQKQRRK